MEDRFYRIALSTARGIDKKAADLIEICAEYNWKDFVAECSDDYSVTRREQTVNEKWFRERLKELGYADIRLA